MLPCHLPWIDRPILWYGFLFASGFFLGYLVLCSLLRQVLPTLPHHRGTKNLEQEVKKIAERFALYVGIGGIVGARLGDLLLYQDWSHWMLDPWEIFKVWEGGLASHGGAVGILAALIFLLFYVRKHSSASWCYRNLLDLTVIPVALAGACIRLGNFINQEILGKPSTVPWAVVFLHPADGGPVVPRHPVQLYESIAYLLIFALLFFSWRYLPNMRKSGRISGLFLILVFGFRFFIEFLKEEQSELLQGGSILTMGQILSIPLVLIGVWILSVSGGKGSKGGSQ